MSNPKEPNVFENIRFSNLARDPEPDVGALYPSFEPAPSEPPPRIVWRDGIPSVSVPLGPKWTSMELRTTSEGAELYLNGELAERSPRPDVRPDEALALLRRLNAAVDDGSWDAVVDVSHDARKLVGD